MKTLDIEAGALVRRNIRNYLDEELFKNRNIEYIESKYLLYSKFVVRGNDKAIEKIKETIHSII